MASGVTGRVQQYEETGITVVAGSADTIQTIIVPHGASIMYLTVKNSHASVAWDAFDVSIRPTTNAPWKVHASLAGDFTAPKKPMLDASGSPVALAVGGVEMMAFAVGGIDALRLRASGNGAASTGEVYYHFGMAR